MSSRNAHIEHVPLLEAEEPDDDEVQILQSDIASPSSLNAASGTHSRPASITQIDALVDYTAPPLDFDGLEPPPGYNDPSWSNSVPLEVEMEELARTVPETQSTRPPPVRPFLGPRTLSLVRQSSGYGFTLGGGAPTYVVDIEPRGAAAISGLMTGDRLLEINGEDVKQADIGQVSQVVSLATHQLVLVVAPPPPDTLAVTQQPEAEQDLWHQASRLLDGDGRGGIDPSAPPDSHLGFALCSIFLCPVLGPMAVWHALQVRLAWNRHSHRQAFAHAIMAQKMASAACFYGLMAWLLFAFVYMDHKAADSQAEDPP
eukprot:TRINITY_DN8054_c0_g1_i2.p1 TRINITY_DN8054_c0_g1~~TRINITY_DN8054_c0_g1_i2.p1  ORF type:complete len:315 (+),score=32.83 TRINITY_DN8054_c0_g1_i2:61-1005(+)